MTNSTKTTKREVLNAMLADENISANPIFKQYCEHEIELLDNKKASKTMSKAQVENEEIKENILVLMEVGTNYTCTQILKMLDDERVVSQQKVSALMNALFKDGKVEKILDKKATYFSKKA